MCRFFFASLALIAFTYSTFAQAKHPFTFEDMMKLKRVGEPEVSPDGKWVVFSVVDVNLEANTKTPHIWIVPTAGGQEREIIADQDGDRPRWAPDGKRFAFISNKVNGSQVWIATFDSTTGSVQRVGRLTDAASGAGGELWSPDGKNILFTSDVYPECDGSPTHERECNAKKVKDAEQSKIKAQIFDRLLYRHWNSYKEGKRSHIFVMAADSPEQSGANSRTVQVYSGPWTVDDVRDLTPGDYDAPVFSLGGQDNYAFSPDGQEVCYTSNHDKNEAASTNNDLWIVPVSGGPAGSVQAKNITADNPASDSTPLYSPDGRYIAYRAQQRPGYESDRFRLMLYDRKTGEKKNLMESFDYWVDSFTWAPDAKTVYFTSDTNGSHWIRELEISSLRITPLVGGGSNDDLSVTPNGDWLIFTQSTLKHPNEIFVACPASIRRLWLTPSANEPGCGDIRTGKFWYPLTHINNEVLSHVSMYILNDFFDFQGAYGDRVQAALVRPPNFDPSKKYPVKFLIHGGPQGAWGDDWSYRWNPELFAANGYVVIMINFHGSTGYGQKFIDAINGDWGGAPYEDLMKGLDYAENHYAFIDKTRECALGASYGGYAINWILGHTDRFKCLVSHDGMFNAESAWGTTEELWFNDWEFKGTPYDNRAMYEKWSPHQYAKNFKTPTLVIHGQRDYRLDVSEGLQLFTTLQMEGVPSKMLYFPDEGHWVLKPQNSKLWYETVNAWVDQWTKK